MEYHEYANLFPMMSAEEFAGLVASMRQSGYDDNAPIIIYDGKILDGRNRYKAAQEAGVTPILLPYQGDDPLQFVIRHNLNRRHLNESQRAVIAGRLANMKAGRNWNNSANWQNNKKQVTQPEAADMLNISPRTVARVKAVERGAPDLIPQIESGKMSAHEAQKTMKARERTEARAKTAEAGSIAPNSTIWNVICADIMTWNPDLKYDIIVTDPPYPREYLPLWEVLAYQAAKWLKPGGLVVAMSGQSYLPEIHAAMSKHLTYWWECAYLTPGGQSAQIFPRSVNPFWKPLLVYCNGEYTGKWFGDVCKSSGNDKDYHVWGQSVSGMADVIRRFCEPGYRVLDPFCGAGTTGIAAISEGCYFTGIDNDQEQVNISIGRLSECK